MASVAADDDAEHARQLGYIRDSMRHLKQMSRSLKNDMKELMSGVDNYTGLTEAFFSVTQQLGEDVKNDIEAARQSSDRLARLKSHQDELEGHNEEIVEATSDIFSALEISNQSAQPSIGVYFQEVKLELECMICKNDASPSMYQCNEGHLICGFCYPRDSMNCPLRCGYIFRPQNRIRCRLAERLCEIMNGNGALGASHNE